MPTGVSSAQYPEQGPPKYNLEADNSYFLVRLHAAQAFFEANWLVKPGMLIVSSAVESSFKPGQPTNSLHQIALLQKNVPCRPGLSTNLTDWLPARAADWLRITLKYTVVQDTPFNTLVDQMSQIDLVAKVSLVRPDWAVAVKVSQIVGRLLGYMLGEGDKRELFALTLDLNVVSLKTGYHAVIGSYSDEFWPPTLQVDTSGRLTDTDDDPLQRLSYAVIEVLGLPRRGAEMARGEPWWELLQAGKEQALDVYPANEQERSQVLQEWRATLAQARALAYKEDREYLRKEIGEMIRSAHTEVEAKLLPKTVGEGFGPRDLPAEWQEVLGVRTEMELRQSVRDYQDVLDMSQCLIEQYKLSES